MDESSGRGPIRETIEALIRTQHESDQIIDEVQQDSLVQMRRIAEQARQAGRLPDTTSLGNDIAAVAASTNAAFEKTAHSTSVAFAQEIHALVDLLAVHHHDIGTLPPMDPAGVGPGSMTGAFPAGFARDYVATVTDDINRGATTSKLDAADYLTADDTDIDTSRQAIVDTSTILQHFGTLLANGHAVEIHGPHITDRALELRAGWTRPPDHGTEHADRWRHRPDGRIKSEHAAGHEATRFVTPEAFGRPLNAFLAVADQHPDGLEGFLDEHFPAGIAPIFIGAVDAGLRQGDAWGYRGAGIGTPEAASDWVRMRTDAMRADTECLQPVRTIPFDPIEEGTDPGVRLIFKHNAGGWTMTTYYPSTSPSPDNIRLEDLT